MCCVCIPCCEFTWNLGKYKNAFVCFTVVCLILSVVRLVALIFDWIWKYHNDEGDPRDYFILTGLTILTGVIYMLAEGFLLRSFIQRRIRGVLVWRIISGITFVLSLTLGVIAYVFYKWNLISVVSIFDTARLLLQWYFVRRAIAVAGDEDGNGQWIESVAYSALELNT